MNVSWRYIINAVLVAAAFTWFFSGQVKAEEIPALEHIFVLSVDGLNYEGVVSVPTPNLTHLANEGIIDAKSYALTIDTLEAAQASLLTGTFPEEHKFITANDKLEVESLLDILKRHGKSVMILDGSGGKLKSFARSDKEYLSIDAGETDKLVFAEAAKRLEKEQPFFTYIYLNDCLDSLLSLDEKDYYRSVKEFDTELGDFITKLRKENLYYKSLIIVTSARSSSPSDLVPLIIRGPGCKTKINLKDTMVLDVTPTICELMEVPSPYNCRGIAVYEAFQIGEEEKIFVMNKWVKELNRDRITTWSRSFELQDELYRTMNQITSMKEEKQSMFNFAGEKEQTIFRLRSQVKFERLIYLGIFLVMLAGYFIEYRLLKKKFLLFR